MKFMMMHEVTPVMETGAPPTPEAIAKMGELMHQLGSSGALVDGGGLHRTALRFKIHFDKGGAQVTPGPMKGGAHELISNFVSVRAATPNDAIAWGKQVGEALGNVDVEVAPIVEPWDLGFGPPPPVGTPGRYILLPRVDPKAKPNSALTGLINQMKEKQVFLGAMQLDDGARSSRYTIKNGKRVAALDGPFAESKELVAGYVLLELPDAAAGLKWIDLFSSTADGDGNIYLRPVEEFIPAPAASAFSQEYASKS